jgi:hypothetical protein
MSFLRKQWKPFCLGAWALGCGCIVVAQWCEPEPSSFAQLESDLKRIRIGAEQPVSPNYPFTRSPQVRLSLGHSIAPLDYLNAPENIVYPRPSRPAIDAATRPKVFNVILQQAELPAPMGVRASADHGRICLEFQAAARHMTSLRAEIFRGASVNGIELEHPYATVEVPAGTRADAWLKFVDTRVEPKRTYFYRVRLTGAGPAEFSRLEKNDKGEIVNEVRWLPPICVGAGARVNKTADGTLYASPAAQVVSVESPSNFEVRFSGAIGSVPMAGQPSHPDGDYTGRFAVRVWIPEAQDWKTTTLEVRPGEQLSGKLYYVPAGAKETRAFQFDTRWVLQEITRVLEHKTSVVREQVLKSDGSPELDEKGQPKAAMKTVTTSGIPRDIATFRDLDSGKTHELTK